MKEFLIQFSIAFVFALWEFYLGNNKNIKANSTLEILFLTFKFLIKKIKK